MSTKSKLIIGIVLLAVGAGLVPTGLVANDYLRDEVYDGVPEAMIKIKRDAVSALEPQIPVLATPEVLKGTFDEAAAQLEPMITTASTATALLGLRSQINDSIPNLINVATTAQGIAYAVTMLNMSQGWVAGTDTFFNNATYSDPVILLPSIAMIVGNLSYTATARQKLLIDGSGYQQTLVDYQLTYSTIPGWISDTEMGSGIDIFYVTMGEAWYWKYVLPYPQPMAALEVAYNATEAQLSALGLTGAYIEWVWANWVPGAFQNNFGITVQQAIDYGFYMQWANGSLVPSGVDLGGFKGYEAGIPAPTNLTLAQCMTLWDPLNPLSFTNDLGVFVWAAATQGDTTALTALGALGLSPTQLTMIISWFGSFWTNITPILVLASEGKTINQLSTLALYEQWANGTIFGVAEIPGGFLGEVNPSWAGAPYLEVGLPTASGISLTECLALWDEEGIETFIYGDSFKNMWLPAIAGDPANKTALEGAFGISTSELDAITDWLSALINMTVPSAGRVADLLEYSTGMTLTEIATMACYEQWCNGTINGETILPEGFLSERAPPIYGPPYFEVSLTMYSLALTDTQVLALWDEDSEYSLLTVSGVHKWYKAEEGNTIYETLRAEIGGLAWWQMYAIIEWLPLFRDHIVNKLAKDDRNLPMEPYALGETLAFSLGIGGGALAALGVVFLILSRRT